jgi:hypothetical protein
MNKIYINEINNELLNINLINNNDNELMNTRLSKQNIYKLNELTGLAKKCDWFIHNNNVINITNTNQPKLIFITALNGDINIDYFITKIMNNIKNKFNLIIASEDYTFPKGTGDLRHNFYINLQDKIFNNLFKYSFLNKIFVENLDTICEKTIPIPLGILPQHNNLYSNLIHYIPQNIHNRKYFLFNCSRIGPHIQYNDRKLINNLCITKLNNFVKTCNNEINEIEFKDYLLNSTFTLCIHGGGQDLCPKFWQSILCGSIPIIKHSVLDDIYKRFPVIFVNEFNEQTLSHENIHSKLDILRPYYEDSNLRVKVLQMLKMSYWFNIINLNI